MEAAPAAQQGGCGLNSQASRLQSPQLVSAGPPLVIVGYSPIL